MSKIQLKKTRQLVGIKGNQSLKYVTRPVRYSVYSSDDVISLAAENSTVSRSVVAAVFYAIEQQIRQLVMNGHGVTLGQMGLFYLSTRAKATDEASDAGAKAVSSVTVRFRASKLMKSRLCQGLTFSGSLANAFQDIDDGEQPSGPEDGGSGDGDEMPLTPQP